MDTLGQIVLEDYLINSLVPADAPLSYLFLVVGRPVLNRPRQSHDEVIMGCQSRRSIWSRRATRREAGEDTGSS